VPAGTEWVTTGLLNLLCWTRALPAIAGAFTASAGTQTLRSEDPERSARLVWSEVPADKPRALKHVLLTWNGPKSGRLITVYQLDRR